VKYFSFVFLSLISQFIYCQDITINELDSDTPGVDTAEFIELKTPQPNSPLDGYVLVLFNGSKSGGDSSYFALNLDGFTSDFNGLFVLGGPELSPSPNFNLPQNTIQNGTDAAAVYRGSDLDFPEGTLATSENLVDALVYGTSDSVDQELLNLLSQTQHIDEDANRRKDNESIQRTATGSWFVDSPSPRQLNDGSGMLPIFIDVIPSKTILDEGGNFTIEFSTSELLDEAIIINFSLENSSFTADDYTGNTTLTLAKGTNSGTVDIALTDDNEDEGDEFINLAIDVLEDPYILNNNFIQIIVVDNDYTSSEWGTPTKPTYNKVSSTGPSDYFESLNATAGTELKQAMQAIIAEEGVVRIHSYSTLIDILSEADQNPSHSNHVWLAYREESRPKYLFQYGSSGTGFWNREHIFPRSRGGFKSIKDDEDKIFWESSPDSLRHANSDAHGIRATDANENSSRGNSHYGQYNGPSGTDGSFKGDVARAAFYLAIRYNGLTVSDGFPSQTGVLGDLETLLQWHKDDPVDDFEMNRNNVIYTWQNNRNPFIDYPELVDYIWGEKQNEVWTQSLSTEQQESQNISFYPNPTDGSIQFDGILNEAKVEVYSMTGKYVTTAVVENKIPVNFDLASGVYLLKILLKNKVMTKKIIIE
jgi:endonuclease I